MKNVAVIPVEIHYKIRKVQVVFLKTKTKPAMLAHKPNIVHAKVRKVPSNEKQRQEALRLRPQIQKLFA